MEKKIDIVTLCFFCVFLWTGHARAGEEAGGSDAFDANSTWHSSLPLRVPPALRNHVESMPEPSFESPPQSSSSQPSSPSSRSPRDYSSSSSSRFKEALNTIRPGVYSCGHVGEEMFINFINPSYPDHDSTAGTCKFRVRLTNPDVCQIRVDFVDTEMLVPRDGNCVEQWLVVTGAVWPTGFNRLCGINPDQHFYVHVDKTKDEQVVDFQVTTVTSSQGYKFGFWITQVNCRSRSEIETPAGCSQYFFGAEGVIKTFNFEGVQYLANQNYRACIRTERNACYMVYATDPNHFKLQLHLSPDNRRFTNRARSSSRLPSGRGNEDCGLDYVLIPDARGNATSVGPSFDRFCGGFLNVDSNQEESVPIFASITSQVSWIQIVTSARNEDFKTLQKRQFTVFGGFFGSAGQNTREFEGTGAGFRLRYAQMSNCINQDLTFIKG